MPAKKREMEKDEQAEVATRKSTLAKYGQTNTWHEVVATTRLATLVLRLPPNLRRVHELPGQRAYKLNGYGMEDRRKVQSPRRRRMTAQVSPFRLHPPRPPHISTSLTSATFFSSHRCNSQLQNCGLVFVIVNLVVAANPPAPNPISARIINAIPGCDITFGARCIFRTGTSRLGVGKRAR